MLVFAGVLLTRFPGIGGWDSGGVLLIAAIRLLSHGIETAIFSPLWWVGDLAQEGCLTATWSVPCRSTGRSCCPGSRSMRSATWRAGC